MAVPIPGGIEPKHLADIREIMESILANLEKFKAKQVNLRLNKSAVEEYLPYFIDWVGGQELKRDRNEKELDPGLFRFGDNVPSVVYNDTLNAAPKTLIDRDWGTQGIGEKQADSKVLAQKAKLTYQKFIGIIAKDEKNKTRCVGTLTAGFKDKPNDSEAVKIDEEMKKIASWPSFPESNLVTWIQDNLVLGGPVK
jgi:hypothetical protein